MHRKQYSSTYWLGILLLCSLASPVQATMVGLSTETLAGMSELIVCGQVKQVRSDWTANGRGIYTTAMLGVTETLKGSCPSPLLTVEYRGGTVGERGHIVSDEPRLSAGEEVLLFLRSAQSMSAQAGSVFNIVGRAQGKYVIGGDGRARKSGYALAPGNGSEIDNDLAVTALKKKILQFTIGGKSHDR